MEADSCAACASGDAALERMATTQKRLIEALRLEHEARKRQENDRENEALSWRALYAEMVKSNQAVTAALWEEKRKAEERDRERERAAELSAQIAALRTENALLREEVAERQSAILQLLQSQQQQPVDDIESDDSKKERPKPLSTRKTNSRKGRK